MQKLFIDNPFAGLLYKRKKLARFYGEIRIFIDAVDVMTYDLRKQPDLDEEVKKKIVAAKNKIYTHRLILKDTDKYKEYQSAWLEEKKQTNRRFAAKTKRAHKRWARQNSQGLTVYRRIMKERATV